MRRSVLTVALVVVLSACSSSGPSRADRESRLTALLTDESKTGAPSASDQQTFIKVIEDECAASDTQLRFFVANSNAANLNVAAQGFDIWCPDRAQHFRDLIAVH